MFNTLKNLFISQSKDITPIIEIEELIIVDNSYKHKSHKFFSPEKFHLHLKIKSFYLKSISRVNAQKQIMKILKEDLKSKIHALEITIER